MRIIAGKFKGRKLNTLEGLNTRPMLDRMKESVFNILGPYFDGQKVLDLFGGSGALSLEALSRGCLHADIVEISKEAMKVIESNVDKLKAQNLVNLHLMDHQHALFFLSQKKQSYDLIFLDPPYRLAIIDEVIVLLINNAMLNDGAYIICHYRRKSYEPKTWKDGFGEIRILKNYHYTTNEITIYQYLKAQQE